MFETTKEQAEIYRWMFLATRLNGAADSGKYGYIDTAVILRHVEIGDVFEFLEATIGRFVVCPAARCRLARSGRCYPGPVWPLSATSARSLVGERP